MMMTTQEKKNEESKKEKKKSRWDKQQMEFDGRCKKRKHMYLQGI